MVAMAEDLRGPVWHGVLHEWQQKTAPNLSLQVGGGFAGGSGGI